MSTTAQSKHTRTDTGLKHPSTQRADYRTGNLDRKRDAVLDDFAPSIPEIDINTFTESFLPPLPSQVDAGEIFGELIDSSFLCCRGEQGLYWSPFEIEPTKSSLSEAATFIKFREIYDKVIEKALGTRTAKLSLNPNRAPFSMRTHDTRPDGYMILREPSVKGREKDCWEDVAVTMEFKKDNDEASCTDNMKKQVFSMQQLMTYDPCRRFTFGLTIENTDVRLWFCSRSMLAVSGKFDLNDHPLLLVHAFLTFTYASKTELGWDESMTPKIVGKDIQYEIKVGDNMYETQGKPLSDYVAHAIVGRATRVFKVQDHTGKPYVLKDVWLAKGRQPEHKIREEILKDIGNELNGHDKVVVEKHLFTPVDHWVVQVKQKDNSWVNDDTHDIIRKAEFSTAKRFNVMHAATNPKHVVTTTGHTPHASEHVNTRAPKPDDRKITHRYHYRIVYEELAEPLFDLREVSLIFRLLYKLVKVLNIFHRAGWVHRDISAGNVFLHERTCFKLGDLEFAKKMGKDGEHDVRTGTLDFMAFEVENQGYLYLPDGSKNKPGFFYHNSLHELESVWWLATWFLFFHHPSEQEPENLKEQRDALDALFPRRLTDFHRFQFFSEDGKFQNIIECLHADIRDPAADLEKLRASLKAAYKDFEVCLVEPDAPSYIEAFSGNSLNNIHNVFKSKFKEIWRTYQNNDITLVRLHSQKRRHSEDSEDSARGKRIKYKGVDIMEEQRRIVARRNAQNAVCSRSS